MSYLSPIGRRTRVPQAGARQAPQYSLELVTLTDIEAENLIALMDGTATALMLFPGTRHHGTYVSLGDLTESPNSTVGPEEVRWQVAAEEVERPAGEISFDPSASWSALTETSSTWQAVLNTYPTWLDVLRGPPEIDATDAGEVDYGEAPLGLVDGGAPGSSSTTIIDGGSP